MYTTQQQMVDRFGLEELIQLTDRDGTAGTIVTTVLDAAGVSADAVIDTHLQGRYQLPVAAVPQVLVGIGADLRRYFLYDAAASEQVTKRYDEAMKLLRAIAKGEISLGLTAAGEAAGPAGLAQMQSGGRIFDRADSGFI